jgi:hypothetical protein
MIESKRGRAWHVAYEVRGRREKKCIQSFNRKPEGKRLLGRFVHRREDNIKMDTKE